MLYFLNREKKPDRRSQRDGKRPCKPLPFTPEMPAGRITQSLAFELAKPLLPGL